MKVTITVNNYNYGQFILECINSVLDQTYRNIEIIIVDDGSTDDSLEILSHNYANNDLVKIISKENGGQLSAFNETLKYATGDIICFLDADDTYKNNYIEKLVEIYKRNESVDFVFCAMEKFFSNGAREIMQKYTNNLNIGFTVLSSYYTREWVGNPTSSLSMRSILLKKILPVPFQDDWMTRADECLVYGASIMGAKKYYCSEPLVNYRIHDKNYFYGKKILSDDLFKFEINMNKLFKYFLDKAGLNNNNLIELILFEYKTRENKDYRVLRTYIKIIKKSEYSFLKKIKIIFQLFKIYRQKGV